MKSIVFIVLWHHILMLSEPRRFFKIPLISFVEKTPGTCPAITVVCPIVDLPKCCEEEKECPQNQKSCHTSCGKYCVGPKNSPHLS
uniref:WAP domain-containing protein n=1 Tax=Gopherus agassizii TaxID=38772 RepID=A0A452J6W2_9SAUR